LFETIFGSSATGEIVINFPGFLLSLGTSFAVGLVISFTYMLTHKTGTPSQSFAMTLVLLPEVIAVIILLVGNNVARAFSLAGAFSIIRFRSAPGDPKDISYVLFANAVGLAAGMGFLLYAAVAGAALCVIIFALEFFGFGKPRGSEKLLRITIPENLDFERAFDDVLDRYVSYSQLKRIKTTDLGSLYELVFSIVMLDGRSERDFIDELRCRNGNLSITLTLDAQSSVSEF
jgi:hypothetical protein